KPLAPKMTSRFMRASPLRQQRSHHRFRGGKIPHISEKRIEQELLLCQRRAGQPGLVERIRGTQVSKLRVAVVAGQALFEHLPIFVGNVPGAEEKRGKTVEQARHERRRKDVPVKRIFSAEENSQVVVIIAVANKNTFSE